MSTLTTTIIHAEEEFLVQTRTDLLHIYAKELFPEQKNADATINVDLTRLSDMKHAITVYWNQNQLHTTGFNNEELFLRAVSASLNGSKTIFFDGTPAIFDAVTQHKAHGNKDLEKLLSYSELLWIVNDTLSGRTTIWNPNYPKLRDAATSALNKLNGVVFDLEVVDQEPTTKQYKKKRQSEEDE